ncbi:hypothetical protein [Arsukibacterium sp.]|uniref:hypothetical protein n=1 Tax=Arsukibacterium sp. TaxID=1977258 RepID=UPI002FDAAC37
MQNQNYIPLGNLLKRMKENCTDSAALESMAAQFAYLSHLHNNKLSITELQRRTERVQELRAKYQATIVDNRAVYRAKTTQAVSRLAQLRVAA